MTRKYAKNKAARDELLKRCAREFGLPRKLVKRAVREAKLRAVAERLVAEELDSSWNEICERAGNS